ncbi:MAG: hypothetical protein WEC75_06970 [Dehalococcoidia bacterium]
MRPIVLVAMVAAAVTAAIVLILAFTTGGGASRDGVTVESLASPTPARPSALTTWMAGLDGPLGDDPSLISCLDRNGDAWIDAGDDPALDGLRIPLVDPDNCEERSATHAEYYVAPPSLPDAFSCAAARPPLLVVIVGGGGTDMLDASLGESIGLIATAGDIRSTATDAGISTQVILSAAAVTGADFPQTRMEQWIEQDLARRLETLPCLRAVVLGHSHGGVTVTSVLAALEDREPARLYGVLLDRSVALYDRLPGEFPRSAPVLNIFQQNEGWHGIPLDQPNIEDVERSDTLPAYPLSAGAAGPEPPPVTHLNLDDAPEVRELITERVLRWALEE